MYLIVWFCCSRSVEEEEGNGGSIVMEAHWNTQNTSKHITIRIVMCFDAFCVFQWAPITILPPLEEGGWVVLFTAYLTVYGDVYAVLCLRGVQYSKENARNEQKLHCAIR